jgi:hypothetical protein
MHRLLQDIACDVETSVGPDNPLRQVIVNTHSPAVVSQVPDSSLLLAESRNVHGYNKLKSVRFAWLTDTWRCDADPDTNPVARGKLLSYLNPIGEDSILSHEPRTWKSISNGPRKVIDRPDIRQMVIPFSPDTNV